MSAIKMVEVIKKDYQTIVVDTINELPPLGSASEVTYDHAGVPESVQQALDELFSDAHTHANKPILDAIEEPFTTADKTKLDSFNPEEIYVEESRNIHTIGGLAGGGNLSTDRVLKLSLKDIPIDTRPSTDPVNDYIVTVDSAGNQLLTKLGAFQTLGATRVIAYVTPPVDNSVTFFNVADGVMEAPPVNNTVITKGVAPVPENNIFNNVDGYTFIVRLPDALKQTGFLSEITGVSNLVFDEDQFMWSAEKAQWVQMEVGDAVISVHGRFGNVVSATGDYNAEQVFMTDGLGVPTNITVQSEIQTRAKSNGDEVITGDWKFRGKVSFEAFEAMIGTPVDGQLAYYSNGVDNKFMVVYKVLSTMPTPGTDGWYKVSDDTLLVP